MSQSDSPRDSGDTSDPDAPTRQQLDDGLAAEDVAYLLCGKCEMPVYFDPNEDENPHGCFCDDGEDTDRWRMLNKRTVSRNAGVFM